MKSSMLAADQLPIALPFNSSTTLITTIRNGGYSRLAQGLFASRPNIAINALTSRVDRLPLPMEQDFSNMHLWAARDCAVITLWQVPENRSYSAAEMLYWLYAGNPRDAKRRCRKSSEIREGQCRGTGPAYS
jgi:hypothetical protein